MSDRAAISALAFALTAAALIFLAFVHAAFDDGTVEASEPGLPIAEMSPLRRGELVTEFRTPSGTRCVAWRNPAYEFGGLSCDWGD